MYVCMKCLTTLKDEVSEEVDSAGHMEARKGVRGWRFGFLFASPPASDWKEPLCLAGGRVVMLS